MKAVFKRVVFKDEWFTPMPRHHFVLASLAEGLAAVCPPRPLKTHEFTSYVLGFRWEATPEELELIQRDDLFGQPALQLHDNERAFTFAELLGPEFIPEVNVSQTELLKSEAKIRGAAMVWTHSFANMNEAD